MSESQIFNHQPLLLEKAVSEKGRYAIITNDPIPREDIWRQTCRALKGSVKHATKGIAKIHLNNGSEVVVLVSKSKEVPRWLSFDAVYFDRSYE